MPTLTIAPDFKIHALQTGTVTVHPPHANYRGPEFLKQVRIITSRRWTEPFPIWVWAIESPEGNFLVDTGENIHINDPGYFAGAPVDRFIHRRILRVDIRAEEQLEARLDEVGLGVGDLDGVVLTHLHIDHTDGLRFLKGQEVMVAQREWEKPWGAVPSTWPKGFAPSKIDYRAAAHPFRLERALTTLIRVVPTPGHSHGHQSVLVDAGDCTVMLAGDTSFSQAQLLAGGMAGISIDFRTARQTNARILDYARQRPLVYLPSHDPEAADRLLGRVPLLER